MDAATLSACAMELAKIARIVTPLQPHQERVVQRIQQPDQPGLVVAHGLGSGKTLTAIAAQDALGMSSNVVVPAALKGNYHKEIQKHQKGARQKSTIESQQNLSRKGPELLKDRPMLTVDEAHRFRDPASKLYQAIKKVPAKKRLLLTGSPFYNPPADIAPLIDVASGQRTLPIDKAEFEKKYISEEQVNPGVMNRIRGVKPGTVRHLNQSQKESLQKIFDKWVDYHPGSEENFPSVEHQDVRVPMSEKQLEMYDTAMGEAPLWVRAKVKAGLPPNKREALQLNAFLNKARQIANTTAPFTEKGKTPEDPKIQKAFEELKAQLDKNPRAKAVVYSNFLAAGIDPYKKRLTEAKIPYGEFTGKMGKTQREEMVKQYNAGKLRALLLSSAGGEGLDLKGTRLLQELEPHWNEERGNQVEGRGIRYMSHADLPPEERNVLVQRFLSTRQPHGFLEKAHIKKPGMGVDEYLTQLSANKEQLNAEFRALLREQKLKAKKEAPGNNPGASQGVKNLSTPIPVASRLQLTPMQP